MNLNVYITVPCPSYWGLTNILKDLPALRELDIAHLKFKICFYLSHIKHQHINLNAVQYSYTVENRRSSRPCIEMKNFIIKTNQKKETY